MSGKSELPVDSRYVSSGSDNSDQEYAGTTTALGSDTLEALRNRVSGGDATFDQTEDVRYYKPIDTYEGIHRWDPEFEWEESEEKKIVRKVNIFPTHHEFHKIDDKYRLTCEFVHSHA